MKTITQIRAIKISVTVAVLCATASLAIEMLAILAPSPAQRILSVASADAHALTSDIKPCPDRTQAAMDNLYPQLSGTPNALSVWLNSLYSPGSLDAPYWQLKIDVLKKWAASLPNRCDRESYLGVINYFQGELQSAEDEVRTHSIQTEQRQYDMNTRREMSHDSELPEPPLVHLPK